MIRLGEKLECGCVVGYYWCWKHDIYMKQDPKDPAWNVSDCNFTRQEREETHDERTCTCFISAPCSVCVNKKDEESR